MCDSEVRRLRLSPVSLAGALEITNSNKPASLQSASLILPTSNVLNYQYNTANRMTPRDMYSCTVLNSTNKCVPNVTLKSPCHLTRVRIIEYVCQHLYQHVSQQPADSSLDVTSTSCKCRVIFTASHSIIFDKRRV